MSEDAKWLARDLLRATGSSCPVQAHTFAQEAGFTLRPTCGRSSSNGDVFEFDATVPLDEQESAVIELLARWVLRRCGDAETADNVADVLDLWLGASDVEDGEASGALTQV